MKWRKPILFATIIALLVLLAFSLSAGANDTKGTHYVSIASQSVPDAAALDLKPVIAYDYGGFQWLVLGDADYDKLAGSGIAYTETPDAGTVQITGYRFDPLSEGEPDMLAGMLAKGDGPALRLVQFFGPTNDAWLASLAQAGLKVLQYYPHYTYLVWGTADQVAAAQATGNVRWTGMVHPGYKMNSDLLLRSGRVNNVDIFFYNDGNIEATLDAIAALGGRVITYFPAQPDQAFFDAIVEFDAARFNELANLDTVLWFGFASPEPRLDDEMSSQILAGNYVGGVPFVGYFNHLANLGYDGSGVIWAIIDTGVDYDHPDLGPHIVGGHSYPGACSTNPGEDCSGGGHGTHVAGIVGGDATAGFTDPNGYLYGLGVAPGYSIFASNSLSAAAWPPAGGWQEHSQWAVQGGAIGGNNSWTTGEGTNHGYQASERTHDIMVLDGDWTTTNVAEPFIEVFSAGNSGPGTSTLTAPKEGKNLIVTASSQNYRVGSIDTISSFSSRGPAVDGRWVPTIATPGEQISSSRNDLGGSCSTAIAGTNNLYAFCSGTSMAAPHTSGAITLVTEWWRAFNSGANPSTAMAKALMVNGAVDMGTADIPNINEGWGRINTTNIISPSVPVVYQDLPVVFGNSGESWTLAAGVADPSKPVKITLAWSDAPGAVGANPALVNNLNLTVVNGANTYLGNVFSGGWSSTGGAADAINNLENVYIQNPAGGLVITVDAANIAGDAILYNADPTDQSFALICQNCALYADFSLVATPAAQSVCAPSNALYTVNVDSILGFNDPVTLSASGNPAGTSTSFSTNPVNPPGSSTLTISGTGSAAAGSYAIDVVGVAPTSTHTTTVQLNLFTTPGSATLASPANGAINVPLAPTFTWTGSGDSFTIEIATDAAFTNIVESATTAGTSYTSSGLGGNFTYYWRVTADNACGAGVSATWSFTTVDLQCSSPNLAIPDNNPAGITNDLVIANGGTIDDLNVSIDVTHTWVGDTVFSLTHVDTGTTVTFYDRPGVPASTFGCSGNDIDATLDDEAATPVENECGAGVPAIAGSFIPNNALAAFDGEDVAGTWRITAYDLAGGDTGTLNTWCVDAATTPTSYVATLSDSVASGGPGETVVHSFTLTNLGLDDTYDLTLSAGSWSASLLTSTPISVLSGNSATIQVAVDIPAGAMLGDNDSLTLTATSQGDPLLVLDGTGTTTADGNAAIGLTGDLMATGTAGQTVTYTLEITNDGDITDTFDLALGASDWTAALSASTTGPLAPGASITIEVYVTVGAGSSDAVDLTVTSQFDPSTSTTVTMETSTYLVYLPVIVKP